MAINPEIFSDLANALTVAAQLARQRALQARKDSTEADQLLTAVRRAVEAARQLRPSGEEQA